MSVSFSIVKVRVLWRDWLICEVTRTMREYKKNAKGVEEEKNYFLKFKNERDFLHSESAASPWSDRPSRTWRYLPQLIIAVGPNWLRRHSFLDLIHQLVSAHEWKDDWTKL